MKQDNGHHEARQWSKWSKTMVVIRAGETKKKDRSEWVYEENGPSVSQKNKKRSFSLKKKRTHIKGGTLSLKNGVLSLSLIYFCSFLFPMLALLLLFINPLHLPPPFHHYNIILPNNKKSIIFTFFYCFVFFFFFFSLFLCCYWERIIKKNSRASGLSQSAPTVFLLLGLAKSFYFFWDWVTFFFWNRDLTFETEWPLLMNISVWDWHLFLRLNDPFHIYAYHLIFQYEKQKQSQQQKNQLKYHKITTLRSNIKQKLKINFIYTAISGISMASSHIVLKVSKAAYRGKEQKLSGHSLSLPFPGISPL